MATKEKVEAPVEVKEAFKYFRTRLAGLKVVVNDQVEDPTLVEYERFTPVKEKFQGDTIKVGYLKTKNPIVLAKLEGDANVEEISADEYSKAVK